MPTQPMKLGIVIVLLACGTTEAADTLEARLFDLSSQWDRVKDTGSTISPACTAVAPDSYNDGVPYAEFEIQVDQQEALDIIVIPLVPEGILLDPYVAIYCAPFDPADPMTNLVATDDDGRGAPNAGFESGDNVLLEAATPYFVVVTSYGSSDGVRYGTFRIDLGGTAVFTGASCAGSTNNDGMVDFNDLLAVLAAWGPCMGCPEDFDGNGDVGFTDLLTVLAGWGKCE